MKFICYNFFFYLEGLIVNISEVELFERRKFDEMGKKMKVIIVGGSIVGVLCVYLFMLVGWDVLVFEKFFEFLVWSFIGVGFGFDF